MCFLSNHTKTPKAFQQYSSHSLQGTLSPTAPTPNPNSRTYPNHPSGPTSNSKKKAHLLKPQPTKATTRINNTDPHTTKFSHISQIKKSRSLHQKETECQLKQTKQPHNPTHQPHNSYQKKLITPCQANILHPTIANHLTPQQGIPKIETTKQILINVHKYNT